MATRDDQRVERHLPTVLRVVWPVLVVIGLLTMLAAFVVSMEASAHREGLGQITATGEARAAIVEVVSLARNYMEADEAIRPALVDELSASVSTAVPLHQTLMKVSETEFSKIFKAQERLERVDATLEFNFEQIQEASSELRALHEVPSVRPMGSSSADAARGLITSSRQYLVMLDHIDLHIARRAESEMLRLQVYEAGAVAASGLLLVVLALFVIRPSHKYIDRQINRLKTNRGMLAEAMIAAEKVALARERLLKALSHDVRAPLQTILLNIEIVRAAGGAVGEGDQIDSIARSARRIKAIVDELLNKALRLEDSELTGVDIEAVVDELVAIYTPQAKERGLELKTDVEEHLPPIFAREDALKRVLENLVTNAIRYTEHGEVTIRACSRSFDEERFIALEVVDTGPGLSEDEREEIFEEGRRLAADEEGHGLGLAIVKRLVTEDLDGELLVDSTVGKGSTFGVLVPMTARGRIPATGWQPEDFLDRLRETRAFEELVAFVVGGPNVQEAIGQFGVRVTAVEGDEFEAAVNDDEELMQAHLVVFDADQLAEGGCSVCESLRRVNFSGPIVGLYSNVTRLDRDRVMRAGCDALLRKPADPVDMVEWLARALTRPSGPGVEAA